jgi:transposase
VDLIRVHSDRIQAASTLKTLAKNSIGTSNAVTEILFKNTLGDIFHYQSQIDLFDDQIEKMVLEHFPNLLTVPGVGPIIAALIVGEIGDVHRFKSPVSLVAYAGIDPVVHESGLFKAKNVHISKRGSRYLRSAIYTATKVACISPHVRDNKFRQKYARKKLEGKHHNSAIFHSAKNMINVIYALLMSGDDFNYAY